MRAGEGRVSLVHCIACLYLPFSVLQTNKQKKTEKYFKTLFFGFLPNSKTKILLLFNAIIYNLLYFHAQYGYSLLPFLRIIRQLLQRLTSIVIDINLT